MSTPTDFEQYLLQLINRARQDPQGEVNRLIIDFSTLRGANAEITSALNYFNVDPNLMAQQLASAQMVAPLAWNTFLNDAASAHSQLMIQNNQQSHQLPGESSIGTRISSSGYANWSGVGENIFAYGENVLQTHAGFYIDWGSGPGGMQTPAGHRNNILVSAFTEVGIDVSSVSTSSPNVGPLVTTEDFGSRFNYKPQVVGAVFSDKNNDHFYQPGEGLSGVTVTLTNSGGSYTTTTWSSGGYEISVPAGSYMETFSGGNLTAPKSQTVTLANANVEADYAVSSGGNGNIIYGTPGNDVFYSSGTAETILMALEALTSSTIAAIARYILFQLAETIPLPLKAPTQMIPLLI